ncbi:MAG: sodium/proton-translocating pyrophosphatase, partial [Elusimicrobiales bacterium]|nr:sodium/proton-translocating pyrophosphatase [Elusimicrobiales bacterium]
MRKLKTFVVGVFVFIISTGAAFAGEADLVIPDLSSVHFIGISGHNLLIYGLIVCALGIIFGLMQSFQIKKLPVHKSMKDISELIYSTCKTYLFTQGKFIAILWVFIASIMVIYFGFLLHHGIGQVSIIVFFSIVGILGSYTVAWFGIRINTYANSRTAFASLASVAYPTMAIPLKAGMSIGMLLISIE